jgi:hypothetical protein
MPIEILELVVRANVQEASSSSRNILKSETSNGKNVERQHIVQECVAQVLEILKRKEDR